MIVIFFDLEIGNIKNANNNAKPKNSAPMFKQLVVNKQQQL